MRTTPTVAKKFSASRARVGFIGHNHRTLHVALVSKVRSWGIGLGRARPTHWAPPLMGGSRRGQLSSASPTPFLTTADYMPPNGFFTVSLLVTDVTPGTPRAIASTLLICVASVTVPFSVTAPSFAMTLMSPALISLYFPMAA